MPRKKGVLTKNTTLRLTPSELADLDVVQRQIGATNRTETVRILIRNAKHATPSGGGAELREVVRVLIKAELPALVRMYLLESLAPGGGKPPG